MGAILNAKDVNIRRNVAMKVMLDSRQVSKEQVVRFIEEAQVTGQLTHPNIVPVHELSVDEGGNPYYTMKMIHGSTLKEIIKDIRDGKKDVIAQYPLNKLLQIFLQACNGVAYAHSKGVIHRDIKPENIMVGAYGEVLVVDWGLAKIIGKSDDRPPAANDEELPSWIEEDIDSIRNADDAQKTLVGSCMGTPAFMAPEQAKDASSVDHLTDVYALGGVLYNLLTLRPPVSGNSLMAILTKVARGDIEEPSSFNVESEKAGNRKGWRASKAKRQITFRHCPANRIPSALSAVAMKSLATNAQDRYQSVAGIQADIQSYMDGFATAAENAGFGTQLRLLVNRNKGLFGGLVASVVLLTSVVIIAFINVKSEQRAAVASEAKATAASEKAEANAELATRTISELKGAVPQFLIQVRAYVEKQEFDAALQLLDYIIKIDDTSAEAYCQRGHLLQTQQKFEAAIDAYQQAMKRRKRYYEAYDNEKICRQLIRDLGGRPMSNEDYVEFSATLRDQGRISEAGFLLNGLDWDDEKMWEIWWPLFSKSGIKGTLKGPSNGRMTITLDKSVRDLSPLSKLSGMPIDHLIIPPDVSDLAPLKGMNIRSLVIESGNKQPVATLEPLRGMPLRSLHVDSPKVSDISPLAGMRLTAVRLGLPRLQDIGVLKGMPIRSLRLTNVPMLDLSPLAGMPLKHLEIAASPIEDLSILRGMHLEVVDLRYSAVSSLEPLRGMKLKYIDLQKCENLTDLSPLQGMPLETIKLPPVKLIDISFLRAMPTLTWIHGKPAADFWKEYDLAQAAKAKSIPAK